MQKILFLSVMNGSSWGGSEELWYQAALETARRGIETAVCCFNGTGKESKLDKLKQAGCKIFLLPGKEITKKQPLIGKIKLSKAVADVPFEEYDKIIVSQGGWKDVTSGPFKKLYSRLKEYVLIYHNYNVNEKFSQKKSLLLKNWADNALKNLGDTPKIFEAVKNSYSISIQNQEKLFNPLTFEVMQSITSYPEAIEGKYILSVFAALDVERKAQDILIKALAAPNWQDRNWELRLYGEGKDRGMLQNLILEQQMQTKILLHGNAINYKEAISQSHLVLQITKIDAMPITVMDSLAMAKPLIVSNVGDMPSWIQENINGWVTATVSVEAIRETLELAWEQRNNWPNMGKQSFSIFQQNFPANAVEYFLIQTGIIN